MQQSITNKPVVSTCYYQPDHDPECTCGVRQYPWHNLNEFIIDKCKEPNTPIQDYFDKR
jgi:hypothetical protein